MNRYITGWKKLLEIDLEVNSVHKEKKYVMGQQRGLMERKS